MKKACDKNNVLTVTGIIGIHCRAVLDFELAEGEPPAQKIQSFIADGDAFFMNSDKALVMTPNFTEATQGTRANGTIVEIEKAIEGYTVEFPETLTYSRKLKALKEYCDRMYLVNEKEGVFTVYGLGDGATPEPFEMDDIITAMPNGRFGHGTSLPVNNISFKMNEVDYITDNISQVSVSSLDEFEIVGMTVTGSTVSFHSLAAPYENGMSNILLADDTIVDIDAFEFSGGYEPVTIVITDGAIVFTLAIPELTTITQVKPVGGLMSLNNATTPKV